MQPYYKLYQKNVKKQTLKATESRQKQVSDTWDRRKALGEFPIFYGFST